MTTQSEQLTKEGDVFLQKENLDEAIDKYTEALELSPGECEIWQKRGIAYCKYFSYKEALADAEKIIELQPESAMGYCLKGRALIGLEEHQESLEAYRKALKCHPNNQEIKESIKDRKRVVNAPKCTKVLKNPFHDKELWDKIRSHPKTRQFLKDPSYRKLMFELYTTDNELGKKMQDKRVMITLGVMLGVRLDDEGNQIPREKPETEKELGNTAYKKKDFPTATKHYLKAIELDPKNMIYKNNLAAVFFEEGDYEKCISQCEEAIAVGRQHKAEAKHIEKAFARILGAFKQMQDIPRALEYFQKSVAEHRDQAAIITLYQVEMLLVEDEGGNPDPDQSVVEKNKGNDLFKKAQYEQALQCYSEAIKLNPTDSKLFSNRAACHKMLKEFNAAMHQYDESIRLDKTFVKAYVKKAECLEELNDTTAASDLFKQILDDIDSECQEAKTGRQRCQAKLAEVSRAKNQEEKTREALASPEIQRILSDPSIRQIMQQMQTNPAAAQQFLRNPEIAAKIQKLVEAGIIQMR